MKYELIIIDFNAQSNDYGDVILVAFYCVGGW